jgi:hypothetical protein
VICPDCFEDHEKADLRADLTAALANETARCNELEAANERLRAELTAANGLIRDLVPVIDAARAWYATYAPVGPDDGAFHEDLALFDAVRALDAQEEE